MNREEKINLIISLIEDEAKLIILLKTAITQSLPNIPEEQLDILIEVLNG